MIKKLLLTLILSISLFAQSELELWQQQDKQQHFAGSAVIGITATALARHYGSSKFEAFMIGVGVALLVGISKEAYDRNHPKSHTEDINDVYADTAGGVVGSAISSQFNWRF